MRNSKLMIAAAVAALTVGSGIAVAQSPSNQSPSSSQHMNSGTSGAGSASEHNGSNARGSQGDLRSSQDKGDLQAESPSKRSNARGEQGSERRSQSGQEHTNQKNMKKGESGENRLEERSTTGQAPSSSRSGEKDEHLQKSDELKPNQQNRSGSSRMERGQTSGQGGTMERDTGTMQRGQSGTMERGTTERGSVSGNTATSGSVNLTGEQRTKIHQVIVSEHNAPRVSHVDFDLNVGTVVSRDKVKLVRLPQQIIEIEPQWRGYEYFLVGNQIVIVEPSSLKIVAIVPA